MEKTFKNTEKEYVAPEMETVALYTESAMVDNSLSGSDWDWGDD